MKKIFLTAAGIMLLAAACNARPDTSAKQTPLVQQQKSSDAGAAVKDIKGEQQANKDTSMTATKDSSKSEASKQQTPPPAVAAPQPKTVTITSSGFQPQEVTIRKGDSVKWVNQSGAGSWPASAVHPTHTVYPTTGGCLGSTFDVCRSLEQNESWTFKFDHTGSWNYHDHVNPSRFGRVVVQ